MKCAKMKSFLNEELLILLFLIGPVLGQMSLDTTKCDKGVGCFRIPQSCASENCSAVLTWQPTSDPNYISFQMSAVSAGWVAFALSNDTTMADDSVVDCIYNGTAVNIGFSYNGPHNNTPFTPNASNTSYQYLIYKTSSYTNGRISCSFWRSISGDGGKIFPLNRNWTLFLAFGMPDGGMKTYHGSNKSWTPNAVDVTSYRHYFSDKLGNTVSFSYLYATNEMEFEFQGPINKTGRWISIGFSYDMSMGNDSILDCLILMNGSVVVQNSYNIPNDKRNVLLNSTEGITVIQTSSNNGWLYCACKRNISNFQNSKIFPLDKPYYLLLGDGNLNDDGSKLQHGHIPVISAFAVDVRTMVGNVSRTDESFSVFADNNGNQVLYKPSSDGQSVEFMIQGPAVESDWWIGVGFSYNQRMDNDSVLDCIHTPAGNFIVQNSFNNDMGKNLAISMDGIKVLDTNYAGSQMYCHLTRAISSSNEMIYPLNQTYYLLLAAGPLSPTGEKTYHRSRVWSTVMVNLTYGSPQQTPNSSILCTQPMNCVSFGSNAMVTFEQQSGGSVQINMTNKVINGSGWIGVGFSYDDEMVNDSVIDCILLDNGTVIVKNSYDVPVGKKNTEISEAYLGIQVVDTSYINGTLRCSLKRAITVPTNSNTIFNLTRPYYILLANGPVDDAGTKMYHDANRYASPNAVDVTSDFLVPRHRFYFLDTLGNSVSFAYLYATNEMEFEFQGPINKTGRWISLGFSYDMSMGNDSVLDCLILTNGSMVVQNSYNVPNPPNNRSNVPLNSTEGITVIQTSYKNGYLYCACRRKISNFQNPKIFPLDKPYYLLLGDGNLNDDGTKKQHGHIPVVSATMVDIRSVVTNVSRTDQVSTASPNATTPPTTSSGFSVFQDNIGNQVLYKLSEDGQSVEFVIKGPAGASAWWIAVGFSYKPLMGNTSVLDCILKPDGTFIVQNSYNNDNRVNSPVNMDGIKVLETNYSGSQMSCHLTRAISSNNPQIYPFNQTYYLLLAAGPASPDGIKNQHTYKSASPNPVDVASAVLVPRQRYYFLDKLGNIVSFAYMEDTDEMEFEFQGPINKTGRWISLGFSYDASMGQDSVLDCLILTNGDVVVQNSYNLPNDKHNVPLNSSEGITVIKTSSDNGWLSCAFRRKIGNFQNPQIYPLDKPYYLLLGDGDLYPNGTKKQHGHIPVISFSAVDIRSVTSNVSRSDQISTVSPTVTMPPTSLATPPTMSSDFSVFQDNIGNQVLHKVSNDEQSVEFVIKGPAGASAWWIAVGFSYEQKMGDSSVIDCIHKPDGTFTIQNSYNDDNRGNTPVNMDGIKVLETNYAGSEMSCHLTRAVSSNNPRIYPFDQTYYMLLAAGPVSPSGQKSQHKNHIISKDLVNLTASNNSSQSNQSFQSVSDSDAPLIRAHGCLMITAFVMLMSGAILIARYYKTCWPDDKLCGTAVWFSVHRFIMVLGLFSCAAGFIIIFCYSKGLLKRNFGDAYPSYFWAHGPMGIAVMILIGMNPIIALFRCKPDSDHRWVFNWLHWFVGSCCQILAGITLFFGIKMTEIYYKLIHLSVFWILIAFVGFHVFIELLLLLERTATEHRTKRSFTVAYGMSSPDDSPSIVKQEVPPPFSSLVFRYFVLTLYGLITMGLWLAMIILIGGGFYALNSS